MAILWNSASNFGKAHGGRRPPGKKVGITEMYRLLLLIFVLVALSYLAFPLAFSHRGGSPSASSGGMTSSGFRGSETRIEHVSPTSWTSDDVGTWLRSVDLGVLQPTFKRNGVNGQVLLELTRRAMERDLLIENETQMKRLAQEVKVLKHRVSMSHRWGRDSRARASNAPARGGDSDSEGGAPLIEIKLYNVGDNMFTDKMGDEVEEGVTPRATLHKAAFLHLRDLISLASDELGRPVREFVAHNGDLVTSMEELPGHVYALCDDDFYVLPTERKGFVNRVTLDAESAVANVETLADSPRLFRIASFITPDEADRILSLAADKMEPSTIAEQGDKAINGVNAARTSSTAWLTEETDATVARIRQRVADLIKVPMFLAEDLQVLHYANGQHYHAHHDYFDPQVYRGFVKSPGQNRFITVFFYLSDVEEGGETVFPFVGDDRPVKDFSDCSRGLKVAPKKGDAILFYSLLAHNHQEECPEDNKGCNLDVRSLHGGCDVIRGDKWAANYWVSNK